MRKRIGIYLIGLAINALGIALIIYSAVGAGAWDTVAIGLNQSWGLTIGICTVIIQVFVVLVTGIIERKRLQYESIIAIAIRSIFLDAWIYLVFNHMDQVASWEIQWLYFIFGIISMGIGIGIYMEAHFPKSPIDGLMLAIHNRFQWSINTSRISSGIKRSSYRVFARWSSWIRDIIDCLDSLGKLYKWRIEK